MDKLNKKDVNRVKDTLKGFITKTAGCEDEEVLHREALKYFGKEFADKPALIKQAASAYNSNKSIFKLSSDDSRTHDFALLYPDKLCKEASRAQYSHTIEKAAGAEFTVRFYKDEKVLQKTASAVVRKTEVQPVEKMDSLKLSNYMTDIIADRDKALVKLATRRDICAREASDAYDSLCLSMNMLTKEARAQVAKNIVSAYPIDGTQLINRYMEDNKLYKMASIKPSKGIKQCPQGDIYTKAQTCMVADFAKSQVADLFKEAAADTIKNYKTLPGQYKMYKKANMGIAQAFTGSALSKPVADTLFPHAKEKSDLYNDIVSTKLLNQLREIEVKNVIVDMYGEPFIASYPADEIESATSQALQMLPADQRRHPRKHVSLLKIWVADILGRGGNMSAADTDKILTATSSLQSRHLNDPLDHLKDAY